MCLHVFSNSPSPVVITYELQGTAQNAEATYGIDVRSFVKRNFYVDDGLISMSSAEKISSLIKRTEQALLEEGGPRLHIFVSNSSDVMKHFSTEDLAKDLMSLDLLKDNLPIQRILGISWNLRTDSFTFRLSLDEKPCNRRGVLSCVNSFYDLLGSIAPVLIRGKLLLRKLTLESTDWNQHLPQNTRRSGKSGNNNYCILRTWKSVVLKFSVPTESLVRKDVHVFTDES
ncbi:uncharacterized protein LOC133184878 [Saccostrea echinata]|uniref:uncharacterized protein LOC133184878 n=1 Tax=Saccostrea echinata TaxID=191078 RepID=UPI002A7EEF01|nr:uncharacterized protein LOC133184878 [Saccostrea echinata]